MHQNLTRTLMLLLLLLSSACLDAQASSPSPEHSSQLKSVEKPPEPSALKVAEEGTWIQVSEDVELRVAKGKIVGTKFLTQKLNQEQKQEYQGLVGSRYLEGDVHATDITPQLWRSLDVELKSKDGSVAKIGMIRPLWWLQITGAKEGGTVFLEAEEAGLSGEAKILDVRDDVRIDSRKMEPNSAPVIGTIKHQNARVIQLVVDGDESSPLGVTPPHPLYSADRDMWVPAGEFKVGESIKAQGGSTAKVTAVHDIGGRQTVYNLEVHRAKSYYVGKQRMLAHNTGIDDCLGGFRKPVTGDEVAEINRSLGGTTELNGSISTVFQSASYYNGFYKKSAAVIRGIAHGHLFDNGNKRTAHAVFEMLKSRNNVGTGVSYDATRRIINKVATGEMSDIGEIAKALRGF